MMRQTTFILLALVLLFGRDSPRGAQSPTASTEVSKATTPAQGSAERKALLDAVRARLRIKSQFKVYHLKVNGDWAFFHGGEVVPVEGEELQETDLDVKALLVRKRAGGKAAWAVAELWTLPAEHEQPYHSFVGRVRRRQRAEKIPADILPDDL